MSRCKQQAGYSPPRQMAASELVVGEIVAQRELCLDAQAFSRFATLTGDAHPIHYDADYAHQLGHPAPIAHGLLLVSISALGATALSTHLHDAMIAMLSVEARFLHPVYLNDRVRYTYRVDHVEAKRDNRSKLGIAVSVDVVDEHGKTDRQKTPCCQVQLQFLLKTHLEE